MNKKGDVTIITTIAFALLVLFILIAILNTTKVGFIQSIKCDDSEGLYACKSRTEGCGEQKQVYSLPFGCGGGICCGTGKSHQEVKAEKKLQKLPSPTVQAFEAGTAKKIPLGSTLDVYVTDTRIVEFKTKLPSASGYTWHAIAPSLLMKNGAKADELVAVQETKTGDTITSTITFSSNQDYVGETVTYAFGFYPEQTITEQKDGQEVKKKIQGSTTSVTLKFKIITPVKYAGLIDAWSQKKTVSVTCDKNFGCENVYFQLIDNTQGTTPAMCDEKIAPTTPLKLSTSIQYCVVNEKGLQENECKNTENECLAQLDTRADSSYDGAQAALMAAIQNGLISPAIALSFAQSEAKTSTGTCEESVKSQDINGVFIVENFKPETQTGTILLDRASMSGKSLCVYAQGKGKDNNNLYPAGRPRDVKIDKTPPVATIDFHPGTLKLKFQCDDPTYEGGKAMSGCKDTFGLAYIKDIAKFLPALVSKSGQSAAMWCPQYRSGGGYASETRREILYTANEVRVLCLRVEDNAGNAGVAKVTVYNAYDLLAKTIALYLQEKDN